MNKYLKLLLLGLLIWGIPFLTSILVWDVQANAPAISPDWFYALMSFTGMIGFGLAAYAYFKDLKGNTINEGWTAGIIWYIEMIILDMIFLIGVFKMTMPEYYPMFLAYAGTLLLSVVIGWIKNK